METKYTIRFSLLNPDKQALMPQSWRDLYKTLMTAGIAKSEQPAVEKVKNDGFIVLKISDLTRDELLKTIEILADNSEIAAVKMTLNSSKMKPPAYNTGVVKVVEPDPFMFSFFVNIPTDSQIGLPKE